MNEEQNELRKFPTLYDFIKVKQSERKKKKVRETFIQPNSIIYIIGVFITTALGILLTSTTLNLSLNISLSLSEIFIVIFSASWLSLSLSAHYNNDLPYLRILIVVSLLFAPISCMFLQITESYTQIAFWITLLVWVIIAITGIEDKVVGWDRFLIIISVIWTITGIIITAGTLKILPYAVTATKSVRAIHVFLDIRFISSTIFIGSIMGTAILQATKLKSPDIPSLPVKLLKEPKSTEGSLATTLLIPFLKVFNVILRFLIMIIDLLWKSAANIAIFFVRVGKEIAVVIQGLLSRHIAVKRTLKVLGSFFLTIGIALLSIKAAKPLYEYLRTNAWGMELQKLAILVSYGAAITLFIAGLCWILYEQKTKLGIAPMYGLSTHLSVLLISGGMIYILRNIKILSIVGFDKIGPFTTLFLILVLVGFISLFIGRDGVLEACKILWRKKK